MKDANRHHYYCSTCSTYRPANPDLDLEKTRAYCECGALLTLGHGSLNTAIKALDLSKSEIVHTFPVRVEPA